jgi:hypothetical protein
VSETKGDQLKNLLYQQVKAVSKEALDSGGRVSAEQLDALNRLAQIVELSEAAQPQPTRKRWPVVVALGCTLLIVSILLFARVPETEIELDLALSEVSFVLPGQQVVAEAMELAALGASGLREVQLPEADDREVREPPVSDGTESAVRLSVVSDGKVQGSINLATMVLPAETHVSMRHHELPRQYRLSLKGKNLELRADLNGPVQVVLAGRGSKQFNFATPQAVHLRSGTDDVDLDLMFPDSAKGGFSSQLPANSLSLFRIDEFLDIQHTVVRQASTILSGTLTFESLNGEEHKLRPGEMIRFEQIHGEIRTLHLQNDQIDLKYHGRVRGMSAGSGENRRSLMPTWLDWLRARHGLSLLWGTAIYLFGLIVGALRWLRVPV